MVTEHSVSNKHAKLQDVEMRITEHELTHDILRLKAIAYPGRTSCWNYPSRPSKRKSRAPTRSHYRYRSRESTPTFTSRVRSPYHYRHSTPQSPTYTSRRHDRSMTPNRLVSRHSTPRKDYFSRHGSPRKQKIDDRTLAREIKRRSERPHERPQEARPPILTVGAPRNDVKPMDQDGMPQVCKESQSIVNGIGKRLTIPDTPASPDQEYTPFIPTWATPRRQKNPDCMVIIPDTPESVGGEVVRKILASSALRTLQIEVGHNEVIAGTSKSVPTEDIRKILDSGYLESLLIDENQNEIVVNTEHSVQKDVNDRVGSNSTQKSPRSKKIQPTAIQQCKETNNGVDGGKTILADKKQGKEGASDLLRVETKATGESARQKNVGKAKENSNNPINAKEKDVRKLRSKTIKEKNKASQSTKTTGKDSDKEAKEGSSKNNTRASDQKKSTRSSKINSEQTCNRDTTSASNKKGKESDDSAKKSTTVEKKERKIPHASSTTSKTSTSGTKTDKTPKSTRSTSTSKKAPQSAKIISKECSKEKDAPKTSEKDKKESAEKIQNAVLEIVENMLNTVENLSIKQEQIEINEMFQTIMDARLVNGDKMGRYSPSLSSMATMILCLKCKQSGRQRCLCEEIKMDIEETTLI